MKTYIVYCPGDGEGINNGYEINAINPKYAAWEYVERYRRTDRVKSFLVFVVDINSRLESKIRVERCGDADYITYTESEHQT